MLIFLANGRLGNQLFQYAFLKTIQKNNEKIVVSGFEDLKEVFNIENIVNLNKKNRWIRGLLFRVCRPILYFLSNKGILTSISVDYEQVLERYRRETTTFTENKGFFSFITFIKLGFFQSENFFDENIVEQLKVNDKHIEEAKLFFQSVPINSNNIFIHIRRGDYKSYKVYGKSTLLPMTYYKELIEWFMSNRKNSFFIFLSDDSDFIENEFNYIENKIISANNHFGTDFAIMSQCNSAILSPSSFGWWGSYFIKDKDTIFSPKYWLGFNSKKEYQTQATPSYVHEVEV